MGWQFGGSSPTSNVPIEPILVGLKGLQDANRFVGKVAARLGRVGQRLGLPLLVVEHTQLGAGRRDGQLQLLGIVEHGLGILPGDAGRLLGRLGLLHHGPRRWSRVSCRHAGLDLSQRRLGHGQLGLGHLDLGQQQRVVQLDQHLALLHLVALVGVEGHDAPAQLGRHRRLLGLDKTRGDQARRFLLRLQAQLGHRLVELVLGPEPPLGVLR